MSIQSFFRTFRSSIPPLRREEISLEDEVTLYRKRADVALREERFQDSLVFLAKVLRLNPYDLQARMTVAEVYHRYLGEPTKALLTYEKVVAAAGYDESNPFCAAAREGIRELTTVFEAPVVPAADLLDGEDPFDSTDDLRREAVS
ncbi:MAG: hypothetical protein EDX89_12675 [Acidobacteria bacterium]|nr:MAG: hypothetical protein EDX89_12675 [Acidobacteriota bacterium]MCE7957975.1 hypothetical protein [Acidobacteria bacterium ACB2]